MVKFEHNRHQIDQARELAKKMKFATFTVSPNNGGRELVAEDSLKTYQVPSKFRDTEYNSNHSITQHWQHKDKNMLQEINARQISCEWSN